MLIGVDIRETFGEKAGKGWYTFHLLKNILKLDKENQYILYSSQKKSYFEKFPNVKIKFIKAKGLFWHLKTLKNIKKHKPDIFFAPTSYIIPAFITRKTKSVFTVHDLVAFLFPQTHNKKAVILERFLLKRAVKKAQRICCVSKNTKNDLLKKFKGTKENIFRVINCGVDNGFRKIDEPKKIFLSVGTIIPRKNYINLIKAFSIVKEVLPDYKLIIIGKKGWSYKEVFEEVHKLGLKNSVIFKDYVKGKELKKYYSISEAFIFPSIYEGFGMPPLEAMKCGCPVISSHISSMKEVVGQAGFIIDPLDPENIAYAILKLHKDKKLKEKLIKRGHKQCKKFSWEKSAQKMINIFKEIQK